MHLTAGVKMPSAQSAPMRCRVLVPVLVLLLGAAPTKAADALDDFSNNLASDLGPILALFGEQPTKQFLSESTTVWESFIFAMAPIGVITAVISAIRVRGSPWMRAFVGRSQEGSAAVEAELCSSTGRDVCEMYQNGAISRTFGPSRLLEMVYLPPRSGMGRPGRVEPFYEYLNSPDGREQWSQERSILDRIRRARQAPLHTPKPTDGHSNANLILNIGFRRPSTAVLVVFSMAGLFLQLSVIAVAYVVVDVFQIKKDDKQPPRWGQYLVFVGTVSLSAGMFWCSRLVDTATHKDIYRRRSRDDSVLFWVQPGNQVLGDTTYDSFISSKADLETYVSSWKPKSAPRPLETLSATSLTLAGFIVQFTGFRAMHSSVAMAQLGAVLVMSILRALLRRGRLGSSNNLLQYWKYTSEKDPREKDPREKDPREKDPREKDPREKDPREKDPDEITVEPRWSWDWAGCELDWLAIHLRENEGFNGSCVAVQLAGAVGVQLAVSQGPELDLNEWDSWADQGFLNNDSNQTATLGAWLHRVRLGRATSGKSLDHSALPRRVSLGRPTLGPSSQRSWPDSLVPVRPTARKVAKAISAAASIILPIGPLPSAAAEFLRFQPWMNASQWRGMSQSIMARIWLSVHDRPAARFYGGLDEGGGVPRARGAALPLGIRCMSESPEKVWVADSVEVEAIMAMANIYWCRYGGRFDHVAPQAAYRIVWPFGEEGRGLEWSWEEMSPKDRQRYIINHDLLPPYQYVCGWDILAMSGKAGVNPYPTRPVGMPIPTRNVFEWTGQDLFVGALHQLLKLRGESFGDYEIYRSNENRYIRSNLADSLIQAFTSCELGTRAEAVLCILPVLSILHRTSLSRLMIKELIHEATQERRSGQPGSKKLLLAYKTAKIMARRRSDAPHQDGWNISSEYDFAYASFALNSNPAAVATYEQKPLKYEDYTIPKALLRCLDLVLAGNCRLASLYPEMVAWFFCNRSDYDPADCVIGDEDVRRAIWAIPSTFDYCRSENSWILPEALAKLCTHVARRYQLSPETRHLSALALLWTYQAAFLSTTTPTTAADPPAAAAALGTFLDRGVRDIILGYVGNRQTLKDRKNRAAAVLLPVIYDGIPTEQKVPVVETHCVVRKHIGPDAALPRLEPLPLSLREAVVLAGTWREDQDPAPAELWLYEYDADDVGHDGRDVVSLMAGKTAPGWATCLAWILDRFCPDVARTDLSGRTALVWANEMGAVENSRLLQNYYMRRPPASSADPDGS